MVSFDEAEAFVRAGAAWLKLGIEVLGALVVASGVVLGVVLVAKALVRREAVNFSALRLVLARYLALALEVQLGADILGTTLGGYTGDREKTVGPDYEFAEQAIRACSKPVVIEGRIHTLDQAAAIMRLGAHAVCVGTAITHPSTITGWFAAAVKGS